jgi:cation-transporting ATPase E
MTALGLIAISDELRPAAAATLESFGASGVAPKIISGDNPETVAALARQAGLQTPFATASGPDLEGLDETRLSDLVEKTAVFGRIGPQDKSRLVAALRARGHYVAMLGDGVNDVLALKTADLAVAMHGGSQAARGVADIVLLDDSFASLTPAVSEGQRIRNGMQGILKLFLTRIGTVASLVVAALVIGVFPLDVRNGTAVTLFAVGLPTLALTLWVRPGPVRRTGLARDLAAFALPAMILSTAVGVLLFYGVIFIEGGFPEPETGESLTQLAAAVAMATPLAQTAVTAFLVFGGLTLFAWVMPFHEDPRFAVMAGALGLVFVIVMLTPVRDLFNLTHVDAKETIAIAVACVAWWALLAAAWRWRVVERYLDLSA